MNLFKKFAIRGLIAGAFIAASVAVGTIVFSPKHTNAVNGYDCDSNAVIYCGARSVPELITKYDNYGSAGHIYNDLHNVYSAFGISSDGVHRLANNVVIGQVHSDGTVWIGSKMIGQNALTAGRQNKPGSFAVPGTGVFARPPSVSFDSGSLDAYIGFEDGKPAWAILAACGNPVSWDRPTVTIAKQVKDPKTGVMAENATFQNGDHIRYTLDVSNTGRATANNVIVRDFLPVGQTYDVNSTSVDGRFFGNGVAGNGINIGSVAVGAVVKVSFTATVSLPETNCSTTRMTNIGAVIPDNGPSATDTANTDIVVSCASQCTLLSAPTYAIKLGDKLVFTAVASVKGLSISDYSFKLNTKSVQSGMGNTYEFVPTETGEYTVSVLVKFSDGKTDGDSGACAKIVKVYKDEIPPTPPTPILPNTGAGDIVGIFVATSFVGAIAHKLYMARKFARL